jgi:hypothetical protein
MNTKKNAIKIAAPTRRVVPGMIGQVTPSTTQPEAIPHKPMGRPRKKPGDKAKGITVTLNPDELAKLEAFIAQVNEGLPTEVPRSDLFRLALAKLFEMKPQQVRTELARRRS